MGKRRRPQAKVDLLSLPDGSKVPNLNDVVRQVVVSWMEAHGYSENALAERLGISQSNLNRFLGADSGTSLETLSLLTSLDGMAPDVLFGRHPLYSGQHGTRREEAERAASRLVSLIPADRMAEVCRAFEAAAARGALPALVDLHARIGALILSLDGHARHGKQSA